MDRKLQKYVIVGIAILIAELVNAFFLLVMEKYKSGVHPYRSTAVQMVATIFIYFPVYKFLDEWTKNNSKHVVKGSQKIVNNKYGGLLLAFLGLFIFSWLVLVQIWYKREPVDDLLNWLDAL